jgi:hypothetical protein
MMQYGEVKSLDALIEEIHAASSRSLRLESIAYCLLWVLPDALKLSSQAKPLNVSVDALGRFQELRMHLQRRREAREVLDRVVQYREHMREGRRLSANKPELKHHAIAPFKLANELATDIHLTKGLPARWPFLPLVLEARSCLASTLFYDGHLDAAEELFLSAETELRQARNAGDYHIEGRSDKEIGLKGFHMSTFTAKAARDRWEVGEIKEGAHRYFDAELTPEVREELARGVERADYYVSPLSQWLQERFRKRDLRWPPRNEKVEFTLLLRRADRRERMSMSGKFMANRGWLELLLLSRSGNVDHLIACLANYRLAMDALVDAYCNAHAVGYRVETGAAERYIQGGFYSAQAQNSLARNLLYCLCACSAAKQEDDAVEAMRDMLIEVWRKDAAHGTGASAVVQSVAVGIRNLRELAMGEVWPRVATHLPVGLVERANASVAA